jgi:hypothetical protein
MLRGANDRNYVRGALVCSINDFGDRLITRLDTAGRFEITSTNCRRLERARDQRATRWPMVRHVELNARLLDQFIEAFANQFETIGSELFKLRRLIEPNPTMFGLPSTVPFALAAARASAVRRLIKARSSAGVRGAG